MWSGDCARTIHTDRAISPVTCDDPRLSCYGMVLFCTDHIAPGVALPDDLKFMSIHSADDRYSEEHSYVELCGYITHHTLHFVRAGNQSSDDLYLVPSCDRICLAVLERPHVSFDSAVNVAE